MWIKIQKMQQYADIYSLQNYSVLKTVPAAAGTGHTTCTATPLQCGLIRTQSRSDHVGGK